MPRVLGADVAGLLAAQAEGRTSAASILAGVARAVDGRDARHRAVLCWSRAAAGEAERLDADRAAGAAPGPLHGVPVMVKDNVETRDLPTTAGSLALADNCTGRDASLVARLRAAGAVIAAKTNLSEWANFRSPRSSSGWSSLGGQTGNALDPTRSPGGSSSGSAVAVALGYVPLAIGTETSGSIVNPASLNGVVGFKPTVGTVPSDGIVPIAHSQDTAGPLARSVADAALGFAVLAGRPPDETLRAVRAAGLEGRRIGVVRSPLPEHPGSEVLLDRALAALSGAGAVVVDELLLDPPRGFHRDGFEVLLHEFRHDLDAWLDSLPRRPSVGSLDELITFNRAHADTVMPFFGQETFDLAARRGPLSHPDYLGARDRVRRVSGPEGLEQLANEHRLDALVAATDPPAATLDAVYGDRRTGGLAHLPTYAAAHGAPHVTVPMGRVHGLPVGLSLVARRDDDVALLGLAHAFEALGVRHEVGVLAPGLAEPSGP